MQVHHMKSPLSLPARGLFLIAGLLLCLQGYTLFSGPIVLCGDERILNTYGAEIGRLVYLSEHVAGMQFSLELPRRWAEQNLPPPGRHFLMGAGNDMISLSRVEVSQSASTLQGCSVYKIKFIRDFVPIQLLIYVVALIPLLVLETRRTRAMRRLQNGQCPQCGYMAFHGRGCPECGLGATESGKEEQRRDQNE